MKAKEIEKLKAIELRKQGLSYSEIRKQVEVSQASISLWVSQVKLTNEQKQRLSDLSLIGQKAAAITKKQQRLKKLEVLKKEVLEQLPLLVHDPFFAVGLTLYWAEGCKQKVWNINQPVCICNSDPNVILTFRKWLQQFCNVTAQDLGYRLYIHDTANDEQARLAWAKRLDIASEVIATTFKHNIVRSRHKRDDYIGLISMRVKKSVWLNRRIDLWIQGMYESLVNPDYQNRPQFKGTV